MRAALEPVNLTPDHATSIGAGIINGSDLLDTAVADARALVVLTDGRQNTSPGVEAGQEVVLTRSPAQRVFAVGLGLNQLGDTLEQIASVTDGVAQVTGELVDEREFLLQKLYVQILSDVSDEAFVRDPVLWLRVGECRATDVYVSEIDVACDFIVAWRATSGYPKHLRMWLEAPDGTVILPSSPLPAVDLVASPQHAFFRVRFPFDPSAPQGHVGRWRVWLESVRGSNEFLETLRYTVMAKARSNLLLGGRVRQVERTPGSPMIVELEPTLFGQPVALSAPVQATVTRPDGLVRTLTLSPDENLTYRGTYTDTPIIGAYRVDTEVSASSPAGFRVTRYRTMTGLILGRGTGTGGTGPGGGGTGPGGGGTGPGGGTGSCGHCRYSCCCGGTRVPGDGQTADDCDCETAVQALRVLTSTVLCCCQDNRGDSRSSPRLVQRRVPWRP